MSFLCIYKKSAGSSTQCRFDLYFNPSMKSFLEFQIDELVYDELYLVQSCWCNKMLWILAYT